MTAQPLTPEEVEDFLRELELMAWDFEMESGNLFDDEPLAEEEPAAEVEEEDQGWRQWDFL